MNPNNWFWRGATWLMLSLEKLTSSDDDEPPTAFGPLCV